MTYGHEGGMLFYQLFWKKSLNKNIRDHDVVGRYGGERVLAIIHFNLK